jgi:hypothetical protein
MTLTAEEIARIRQGEPVDVDLPEVGTRCVLLRADTLARLVAAETDGISREALTELVDRAMAEEDVEDPLLAGYQSCRP